MLSCGRDPPAPAREAQGPPTSEPSSTATPAPRALTAWFGGCREVREGPICAFEPGSTTLRLWIETDPGFPSTIAIDGAPLDGKPEPIEGGLRWVVQPSATARHLEILIDLDGAPGKFALTLDPSPPSRSAELDAIASMVDIMEARRRLDALLPTLADDAARAEAYMLAGDLAFEVGDLDAVAESYAEAFERAVAAGHLRNASTLAQRLTFVYLALRHDEEHAARWLERDAPLVVADPEQGMLHAYYEGLLAEHRGELRAAGLAHASGERMARALGLDATEAAALVEQMLLVGRLGAWERARALEDRALALVPALTPGPDAVPLVRSQLLNAVAWMLLEARGRGASVEQDPVPLLRQALEGLGDSQDVASLHTRNAIMLNLAYAAALDERAGEARSWLERVDQSQLDHEDRLWRMLLLARVARLDGTLPLARRRFSALLTEAERLYEPELRWQALLEQGRIEEALGRPEQALARYAEAERLLDEQLPRIALGEGRGRFGAERDRGVRWQVDLLLRLSRPDEALCVARLARTRALRTVARQVRRLSRATPEQREALRQHREARARLEAAYDESWSLPAAASRQKQRELEAERREHQRELDQLLGALDPGGESNEGCNDLSHPGPGELDLHFVRLDDGWVGFAELAKGLTVRRLGPLALDGEPDPQHRARWSADLLAPFAEALAQADSIRVMPVGALGRVPFHALPIPPRSDGDPTQVLLERAVVRYGLDLPRNPREPGPSERAAVIVAPPSNLRHAAAEAEMVARLLGEAGWQVQRIEGEDALGDAVRRALPQAGLLHYVGHARADGLEGWSSALVLARDGTVDVGDVLALPRAPTTAILNGCETGRIDPAALAGGMSLAHAFVVAGARLVVATDREVDDAAASALIEAFHRAHAAGEDAPQALRSALRQRMGHDDGWLYTRGWIP